MVLELEAGARDIERGITAGEASAERDRSIMILTFIFKNVRHNTHTIFYEYHLLKETSS